MKNLQNNLDVPQLLFSLLFILIMILTCLWIVKPFILAFAWASMVVITTWPVVIRIENYLCGKRSLAVITMTILLLLLFIIPIAILVNSVIDNSAPLVSWMTKDHFIIPELHWLHTIPIVGHKLYSSYHTLVNGGGLKIIKHLQPYIGRATGFFVAQAGHFGRFMMHLALMLLFSILLYSHGEHVAQGVRHFAYRLGGTRGDAAVLLAVQTIRAVALGVVVTALVQAILGGIGLIISGIPYAALLTVLMIFTCLVQLGPLVVLIPVVIWLYWSGCNTWGTLLLIWSCIVATIDNILRPILIRRRANLPTILILSGVIGGLFSFGMIGLFMGPVVLAVSYRLVSVWMHEVPEPDDNKKTDIEVLIQHKE